MSFNVELRDFSKDAITILFGVTPVVVYDRWAGYTGTCVWRCNQERTYSLPGEPEDARWRGLFADGQLAGWELGGKVAKMFKTERPTEYAAAVAAQDKQARWDSDTMMGEGAILVGGTTRRTESGSLEIVLPERKKFLGIF